MPDKIIKDDMDIGKEEDLVNLKSIEDEKELIPKKKLRGTKKNSYKRFNYTKKKLIRRNGVHQEGSKKKKSSRNKRRSSGGKVTRRK